MRLRAFIARDMAEAMAMIRREMGPDAIIVSSEPTKGGNLEVRAAVEDDPEPAPPAPAEPDPLEDALAEEDEGGPALDPEIGLEGILRAQGAPRALAAALTRSAEALGEADPVAALSLALETRFSFRPIQPGGRRPVLLVGPPGAGKTSACGKLAARAAISGVPARLICADAERAGAREQLAAYAEAAGAEFVFAEGPAALRSAAASAHEALVVIDGPATNSCAPEDLRALRTLAEAASAEPVLVLDAGMGAEEAAACARAFVRIGARRLILTKLDAVRRKGAGLAAADAVGLAFAHISASPYLAGGFAPATPLRLTRMLLEDLPASTAARADARAFA